MTRTVMRVVLSVGFLVCVVAFATAQTQTMTVQVKQATVRSTPSFLGKTVATLNYGDQVQVLSTQSGWVRISIPGGGEGWLHESELTKQQLALQSGSNVSSGASSSEVALAGKGFNAQVEQEYQSETSLDYTQVDKMEKINYTPEQLVKFLQDGDLNGPQGAPQ